MSVLPPLYATWIGHVLPGAIPSESKATCDHCAMCQQPEDRPGQAMLFFNSETKCCTYLPDLYNFLVGGILTDADPAFAAGRASVEARLDAQVAVTPLGLGAGRRFLLLYTQARSAFGQSRSLRCPHYLDAGGRCGVWRHRNAMCTTWFCKHDRGLTGMRFWHTVRQLLSQVELSLARWCVLELDVGSRALAQLLALHPHQADHAGHDAAQLDHRADPETSRLYWGKWYGRERAFYREAARLVHTLQWDDIMHICGPEVQAFTRLTQEAYANLMSTELPETVHLNPVTITPLGQDAIQVQTYSPYAPVTLPRTLLDVLPYFDGRPVGEALQTIEAERGLRVSPGLVRKLVDFAILAAPGSDLGSS